MVAFLSAPGLLLGQADKKLTLDQLQQLISIGAPDTAIAGEIERRGLDFTPSKDTLEMLLRLGAGSKTLSAIDKLIPALDKDTSSLGTNQPSAPQPSESKHTTQAFIGSWRNVDANTGRVTRVEIRSEPSALFAHLWGRCGSGECNWGETQADVSEVPNGILKVI